MNERVVQLIQEANRLNNELTAVLIQLSQYTKEVEYYSEPICFNCKLTYDECMCTEAGE